MPRTALTEPSDRLALSEEDACGTLRAMWRRTKMLKLKLILRRAYGFRNLQNMTDMIMLCCSDLEVVLLGDDARPNPPLRQVRSVQKGVPVTHKSP